MSAGWVAGSVRAKALARRRLGAAGARSLAASPSLTEALSRLAGTPYGHDVRVTQSLAEAQHGVAATLLWHLRVLSGWVPREGADMIRLLVAAFEVANVDEHVRELSGRPTEPAFRLGSQATAWGRLSRTTSLAALRETLASSAWGDPGSDSPAAIHLALRLSWLQRVAHGVPNTSAWAAGAAALMVAREVYVAKRQVPPSLVEPAVPLLGTMWTATRNFRDFAAVVPAEAGWALADIDEPLALWRAEAAWWRRVQREGFGMLRDPRFEAAPVLGASAVLAGDAWRVRAALETAARDQPVEVFDGMA